MSVWEEEQRATEKEQKRLMAMSVEELRVELERQTKEALIAEMSKLPTTLATALDAAIDKIILASMGIQADRWNRGDWEIDIQRKDSAWANILGEMARDHVTAAYPTFIEDLVKGLSVQKKFKGLTKTFRKAYEQELGEYIQKNMRAAAKEAAHKRGGELLDAAIPRTEEVEEP